MFNIHYSSTACRAPRSARDGSDMKRCREAVFFVPAAGAPGGRDHGAGLTKTGLPEPNSSGQPGARRVKPGGC